METLEKDIIAIVSEISGIDEGEITLDAELAKDLEIDSIKAIEIVVAIEKKYKISVRDEHIPKINTVRQIVSTTKALLGSSMDRL